MAARRYGLTVAALILAFIGMMAGCCPRQELIADRCAELPVHVQLPDGFYPLRGHYSIDNPESNYNGWPRYIVSEQDNMIMCYVPSQQFTMGGGLGADEVPAREVVVNHFYVDLHEVTNIQYYCYRKAAGKKVLRSLEHDPCAYLNGSSCCPCRPGIPCPETFFYISGKTPCDIDYYRDYWHPGLNDNHPARAISFREAFAYAKWSCKSLPTEAQWEAAARGGDRRLYPWGNNEVSDVTRYLCNARTTGGDLFDGYEYTAPVLSYAPGVSPFGAFNMAGNVWEWCVDWYDPGRYGYPSDEDPPAELQRGPKPFGDRWYPNPVRKDLADGRIGPIRGDEHPLRGGSFADPIELCRVTSRISARIDARQNNFGFRCVLLLPEECP